VWIGVVTVFPEMFRALTEFGITRRARARGLVELAFFNPRDYTHDRHRRVDDRPYGGGPGMVMQVQPLRDAIEAARAAASEGVRVIYLSPQGRKLDQAGVQDLVQRQRLVLVAGRYEGVDERLLEAQVDEEWSVGDYVLSGGELAAMVVIDAVTRTLPDALGHADSACEDSFAQGLLDYPHYTRPEEIDGFRVPEVLLSGNHESVRRWRLKQALGRTWLRRPELLSRLRLNDEQRRLLEEFIQEQNGRSESLPAPATPVGGLE
jgi:tRNA (guanine37-N1)-methyltransferase